MALAYPWQKIQDWFTQQWVILWGRRINMQAQDWLIGPIGELNGIGDNFIYQLAEKEHLEIRRNQENKGLLASINVLNLSTQQLAHLNLLVINFYEQTANYNLQLKVKWNPFFKFFAWWVKRLFSNRIQQLNIPMHNTKTGENLHSEIIHLYDKATDSIKYTIWFRKNLATNEVIYSGVYGTCILPNGSTCIKAVFPLPKGNATVIMKPSINEHGDLILTSAGKTFGNAGFYFLLKDHKENYWAQYIKGFRDTLTIGKRGDTLQAEQILSLYHLQVVKFNYHITNKS